MHIDGSITSRLLLLLHYFELMFGLRTICQTQYNGLFLFWLAPSAYIIVVFSFYKRITYFWQVINIVFNSH